MVQSLTRQGFDTFQLLICRGSCQAQSKHRGGVRGDLVMVAQSSFFPMEIGVVHMNLLDTGVESDLGADDPPFCSDLFPNS